MTDERKSEVPSRKQSEMTVPIDRALISEAAKKEIAKAIASYPDTSIREDSALKDRPTLVRCPEKCTPCKCCGGAGMVTVERAADWRTKDGAEVVPLFDVDEPDQPPPAA